MDNFITFISYFYLIVLLKVVVYAFHGYKPFFFNISGMMFPLKNIGNTYFIIFHNYISLYF